MCQIYGNFLNFLSLLFFCLKNLTFSREFWREVEKDELIMFLEMLIFYI